MATSGHRSHHLRPSSSINNDTASLQPVIDALLTRQKSVCECFGRIGHKEYTCIICGPKLLSPSLRRKTNKLNALHGEETNEPPIQWSRKTPAAHFKYRTSPPNTSPVVSSTNGKLNHRGNDNGDV